jgi:GTP-binding protein
MFIDYAKIKLFAGNGGSGCMSFHREKFMDKGGPDGGDGGRGGSIFLEGRKELHTLSDYRYSKEYKAKRGQHGMGSNKHGKSGEDIVLKIPLGTVIKSSETGEILADVVEHKEKTLIAKGGRGGRGNARFATPTHRSPREWEVGKEGQELEIELELKLIADIGLVGLPNAGKSTLLSTISAAQPKIANYPFTTLKPNLGVVQWHQYQSFVVADIPGLIEGAHTGKGLGHQFLRHIERTRALVYLIDSAEGEPEAVFVTLYNELRQFSPLLTQKPACVVYSKVDVWGADFEMPQIKDAQYASLAISAVTGKNIEALKETFANLIKEADNSEKVFEE